MDDEPTGPIEYTSERIKELRRRALATLEVNRNVFLPMTFDNLLFAILKFEQTHGSGVRPIIILRNGKHYTLSTTFVQKLRKRFKNPEKRSLMSLMKSDGTFGSDDEVIAVLNIEGGFRLVPEKIKSNIAKLISLDGSFFRYLHNTDLNLKRYQIYTREQLEELRETGVINKNCIIQALGLSIYFNEDITVEDKKVMAARLRGINDKWDLTTFKKANLKKLSDLLNVKIGLRELDAKLWKKKRYYGEQTKLKLHIALFKNHYFADLTVNLNKKTVLNANVLDKSFVKENKGGKCPVSFLIKRMDELGVFRPMTLEESMMVPIDNPIAKIDEYDLSNIDKEQRMFARYGKRVRYDKLGKPIKGNYKRKPPDAIIWADFECFIEKEILEGYEERRHYPYAIGMAGLHPNKWCETFWNDKDYNNKNIALIKALDYLIDKEYKNVIMYFHNAKYDINFIENFVVMENQCKRAGNLYGGRFSHTKYGTGKRITVSFRCSYKMIETKLANFSGLFNLDISKEEGTPYNLYGRDNLGKIMIPIEEFKTHYTTVENYSEQEYEKFVDHNRQFIKRGYFDHKGYMDYYLRLDCEVLREGMLKYAKTIRRLFNLDMFEYMTKSSLADAYMIKEGCYDQVYETSGGLQTFLMAAMSGGRCATRYNQKWDIECRMCDFDACSLYPSAIHRLKTPLGKAKLLDKEMFIQLRNESNVYYVVAIKIREINKKQQIPFMSYIDENGTRQWDDNIEHYTGRTIVVDRETLEDLVRFQEVKFEFITGVYWNRYSKRWSKVIKKLYTDRKEFKKIMKETERGSDEYKSADFNQYALKIMMNSAYGKTLLKEIQQDYVFKNQEEADRYINRNYNNILTFREIGDQVVFKIYDQDLVNWNRCHLGIRVLSMSKRIMNEVMDTANSNDLPIYYQDTDSLHIPEEHIPILESKYRKIYHRDLIGGELGEFHNDLEMEDGEDAISVHCIILGKKSYYDKLEGTETGREGHHIRLKGIGSRALLGNLERLGMEDPLEVYQKLYTGEEITFDLVLGGVKFNIVGGKVLTRKDFLRKVKF